MDHASLRPAPSFCSSSHMYPVSHTPCLPPSVVSRFMDFFLILTCMVLSHVPQSDYPVGSDCLLPQLAPLLAFVLAFVFALALARVALSPQAPRPVVIPLGSLRNPPASDSCPATILTVPVFLFPPQQNGGPDSVLYFNSGEMTMKKNMAQHVQGSPTWVWLGFTGF
jgi:hypothetical protein